MIEKLFSGGQTGVDRAALDVALELGIPCAGWCPRGRRAEDGPIDARYPLTETPSDDYAQRTAWNVRDSDGTLIITRGAPAGGTALTVDVASRLNKPCLIVDLETPLGVVEVRYWIERHAATLLNVAGPRESGMPGIYADALAFLHAVLAR